jgi:polar amino acid transport system substrate-binding protein
LTNRPLSWPTLAALCAGTFLTAGAPCRAQAPNTDSRPLLWAADPDGGAPYIFKDPNNPNKLIGFEVDLKDALARELKRPIVFKHYDFKSLFPGLERGDFDFAMNGLEVTPEREKQVRFTRPYYLYQLQLVVRAGEKRFRTLQEAKEQGFVIGTLEACSAERLLDNLGVPKRVYDDQDGPYKDLSLGRGVQGVLLDLPIALYYAAPDPHLKYSRHQDFPGLEFAGAPFAEGYYAIAVRKDNEGLARELDAALQRLRDSGELKRILTKWELWNADQYRLARTGPAGGTAEEMTFAGYFPLLLEGAGMTVFLTAAGMGLAILLGLPIALLRLYGPAPLRLLATVYVEFFRGIPVLLLLFFLYYGLPGVAQEFGLPVSLKLEAWQAAVLGFGLNYAAYEAEIYRAGISSIPAGQWEAAASLGMSTPLAFRRIILPQAVRVILPPMTNDLVALFKDTSVVSIIAVVELSKQYQMLTKSGGGYLQIGLATAALYLVMSVPLGYLSRYLERRWAQGATGG